MTSTKFPSQLNVIEAPDPILESYASDPLSSGSPQALCRPKSVEALSQLMSHCHANNIPVTPCGNRTSLAAGALAYEGVALSIENLPRDWRVYQDPQKAGRFLVDAGPAVNLAELQDALAEQGYFYPPDPTSRKDVLLGATVATNASGEDSYKYGSTRAWVRALEFVKPDGTLGRTERAADEPASGSKNTCGYPFRDSEIDQLIGSEGTLAIITRVTLEVLPFVPPFFSILAFFPSETSALDQVLRLHHDKGVDLRCLEYMDCGAVEILRQGAAELHVPPDANCALYLKQEFEHDEEEKMAWWLDYFEATYAGLNCPDFMDTVQFTDDQRKKALMRDWRHLIPATINERAAQYKPMGGGKVGTDWFVPLEHLKAMMAQARREAQGLELIVFGHIGNGHPHFNFIAHDRAEYKRARQLLEDHCKLAVSYGGGVSGEHGLGKLKRHLLGVQYDQATIKAMKAVKASWDPKDILGRGNIFGTKID